MRSRQKGKRTVRLAYEINGKPVKPEVGRALAAEASMAIESRRMNGRIHRARLPDAPDRRSVSHAMDAVEGRLVKAFWVLHRSQRDPSPREPSQHGIGYMLEREDKWAAAVAGGGWLSTEPAPAPARANEISEADEALEWLTMIDSEPMRRLVGVVAMSKRGDVKRRIPWIRLRSRLGAMSEDPQRTLQWRYREALRIIVNGLTYARMG
jgi:hypothetical protein